MPRISTTPGEILREEFLLPFAMSASALARAIGVPVNRVTAIINGTRSVTADTALRLGRYFGTTPAFWLNLQTSHDLSKAQAEVGAQIEKTVSRHKVQAAA
jgi:addiction module HigA family antidote